MRRLHLSEDFSLPADALTQTFGILGKRGSGKRNAGRVMAEEFFCVPGWSGLEPSSVLRCGVVVCCEAELCAEVWCDELR